MENEATTTPQNEAVEETAQNEGNAPSADVDWEAKYKEVLAQSRKWEKAARADHKKSEKLTEGHADAVARAEAAEAELATYKAEAARNELVREIAKEQTVSAEVLGRMAGNDRETIEANAELLKELTPSNSYPKVKDKGESKNPPITKDEILAIKSPREREKAIAEHLELFGV